MTNDPICGMTVNKASAPHAERDGKTFYFCSDQSRKKFLATVISRRASPDVAGDRVM
jgi:YHS domain-containing protein